VPLPKIKQIRLSRPNHAIISSEIATRDSTIGEYIMCCKSIYLCKEGSR